MTYTEPLLFVLFLGALVGFVRARRRRGMALVALALVGLFLVSWPPFDWMVSRPLEAR